MKYFIKNKKLVTWISQFGVVNRFSDCSKSCHAKRLRAFQLYDFYNFADQIEKTEIFFDENQPNTTFNTMKSITAAKKKTIRSEICIDVQFDFTRRKWTDGNALEKKDFIPEWEGKFEKFWDNIETNWPPQPYQPEFVILNYEYFAQNIRNITITLKSIMISPAERFDQPYYKCLNRNDFQRGSYYDALQNCKRSNSSIQTYFDQVSC